ncbi:prefoldin subunit mgr [Calliopsis andreniformis]|uniref:prefoldin subunit mgr n=1 Tax=Calliopsis andreniformis TaxID=337506 RepID=UPI003FCED53E
MEDGDNKVDVEHDKEKKSYVGIPVAYFVDDVDAFMANENESVDKVLQMLDEDHGKYKFMELNLINKRKRLKAQIPDLERSLEMIKKLQSEKANDTKELETQFLLSEQLYTKAIIPVTDKVCLWLGANVMLEYTLDEAEEVLTKNIESAKKTLGYVEHDLDFLRDQYTTTEVNMARVYNWEVKRRLAAKST